MIEVELRLFGGLVRFLKDLQIGENGLIQVNDGSTIEDIIKNLNIDRDETKIILVNGRPCELDCVLRDADRVVMFPAVVGG